MTWGETKEQNTNATLSQHDNVESVMDPEPETEIISQSMEPAHDIDPMILAKPLTVICGVRQTIERAIELAQKKANEQYTCVKLLDKDSKFVCNIYPTITASQHAAQRNTRIRDMILKIYQNEL